MRARQPWFIYRKINICDGRKLTEWYWYVDKFIGGRVVKSGQQPTETTTYMYFTWLVSLLSCLYSQEQHGKISHWLLNNTGNSPTWKLCNSPKQGTTWCQPKILFSAAFHQELGVTRKFTIKRSSCIWSKHVHLHYTHATATCIRLLPVICFNWHRIHIANKKKYSWYKEYYTHHIKVMFHWKQAYLQKTICTTISEKCIYM